MNESVDKENIPTPVRRTPSSVDAMVVYLLVLVYMLFAGRIFAVGGNKWFSLLFSVGLGVIPFVYVSVFRMDLVLSFRLASAKFRSLTGSIFLIFGVFILVMEATVLLGPFLPRANGSDAVLNVQIMDGNLMYAVLALSVLPAVFEEALCRGFILTGLLASLSRGRAIVICSILFAFLHFDPARILFTFAAGLALSWVAAVTGSLLIPIIMHFTFNLLLFAIVRFGLNLEYSRLLAFFSDIIGAGGSLIIGTVSFFFWFVVGVGVMLAGRRLIKQ